MVQVSVYEYPVRRPFTYNGKQFRTGDMWTPEGLKNDQKVIDFYVNKSGARLVTNTDGQQVTEFVPKRRVKP